MGPTGGWHTLRAAKLSASPRIGVPAGSVELDSATRPTEREKLLDQAIYDGRISAGMRAHYGQCFDADADGTRAFLSKLGPASTAARATPAASGAQTAHDYPESLLTDTERRNLAAVRAGQRHSYIVNGG